MTKRFVVVAGNIGSGKTSITERIGAVLGWRTAFELVADNPYLPEFYADMRQWSFHLQVFFLGHRAQQHQALASRARVGDLRPQHRRGRGYLRLCLDHMGNLTERDYRLICWSSTWLSAGCRSRTCCYICAPPSRC